MSQENQQNRPLTILIADSQELFVRGTVDVLYSQYPDAKIITATTTQTALNQISEFAPDLVILELDIPEKLGTTARTSTGVQFLKYLLHHYPKLNLYVQSVNIKALVRIKPQEINAHQGGFTVTDKNISSDQFLVNVNLALDKITHTKSIKQNPFASEFNSTLLDVLSLAFQEGLQDKAIAKRACISESMVRHYWQKLQEVLEIDCEDLRNQGKNVRIQTGIVAKEFGLID